MVSAGLEFGRCPLALLVPVVNDNFVEIRFLTVSFLCESESEESVCVVCVVGSVAKTTPTPCNQRMSIPIRSQSSCLTTSSAVDSYEHASARSVLYITPSSLRCMPHSPFPRPIVSSYSPEEHRLSMSAISSGSLQETQEPVR